MPSIAACRALARRLALGALALGSFSCGGGGGGGGGVTFASYDLASVTPTPRAAAIESGPGTFAADYLRSGHFTRLVVEVDYPASRPPTQASLDLLRDRLVERCDKPDGVVVVADDAIPDVEMPVIGTLPLVHELEDAYRDTFSDVGTKTVAMYVLYVTGHSDMDEGNSQVLGLAHRGGSFVYFIDRAERGDDIFVTTAEIEGTGLVHEAGHLLGLVGGGVPQVSNHADSGSFYHDADPQTVMYYIVHVPAAMPNLGDDDFAQFNAACVEDLQAFGGLGPWPGLVESQRVSALSARTFDDVAVGYCPCSQCGRPTRR
jgi:hypothetical protein